MNIITIAGVCVLAGVAGLVIRQFNREIGLAIAALGCIGVLVAVVGQLTPIVGFINEISGKTNMSSYVGLLVKALGIAYVAYVGGEVCKSLGEPALSSALELAAKVGILAVCIPVIRQLLGFGMEMLFG